MKVEQRLGRCPEKAYGKQCHQARSFLQEMEKVLGPKGGKVVTCQPSSEWTAHLLPRVWSHLRPWLGDAAALGDICTHCPAH